jgi:cytochrome P450
MFANAYSFLAAHPIQALFLLPILSALCVRTISLPLSFLASAPANPPQILFYAVHLLYFHPLSRYPGPLLARLTPLHSAYYAYIGSRHLLFQRLHARYGPVVRYAPNALSFNSASALHSIYGFKANVRKAKFYEAFPARKGVWSTHSAIDKGLHARKRRVLSQAFGDTAMKGLGGHVCDVVGRFCKAICDGRGEKGWSSPKNMALWANYMSYDVLGDICYGESFGTLEGEENRFAIKLVGLSSRFHYLGAQMLVLKKIGLDRILFPDLRRKHEKFMAYSRSRLQQRVKLGIENDRRDFFYYLLKAKDPETGEGFPMQELWGESNVLLIAGGYGHWGWPEVV